MQQTSHHLVFLHQISKQNSAAIHLSILEILWLRYISSNRILTSLSFIFWWILANLTLLIFFGFLNVIPKSCCCIRRIHLYFFGLLNYHSLYFRCSFFLHILSASSKLAFRWYVFSPERRVIKYSIINLCSDISRCMNSFLAWLLFLFSFLSTWQIIGISRSINKFTMIHFLYITLKYFIRWKVILTLRATEISHWNSVRVLKLMGKRACDTFCYTNKRLPICSHCIQRVANIHPILSPHHIYRSTSFDGHF